MNIRPTVRWLLFLSSYFPLFLVLFVRTLGNTAVSIGLLFLLVVPTACLVWLLLSAAKLSALELTEITARTKSTDLAAYFATYVLAVFPSTDPGWKELTSLAILLCILGSIYVNSGMIHLNPMLAIIGWKVYEVRGKPAGSVDARRKTLLLLGRRPIDGRTVRYSC